ncbi:MAG: amidohydrolase family protein [Candidatus Heimdallarchaeota archaeon]|nr:amidohydrolase family protein [Candidatus Heimdallarchaeota archaeon]MCK4877335.1 amidohydrolase family protein [Candidatus Heimdallarchaeota archaeon]
MKNPLTFLLVLVLFICPLIIPTFSQADSNPSIVDFIFCNGNIITIDEDNPQVQAIAIDEGSIVGLGSTETILQNFNTENDTTYDLDGRTIMPGIIDGHSHYMASLFWIGERNTIYDSQSIALAYGYTTLNEKSVDHGELAWFQSAEQNGTLRLRVNAFLIYNFAWLENNESVIVGGWEETIDQPVLDPSRKLRIPGFKIYADGASGDRGFPAMSEPYPQEMIDAWGIINPYGDLYFNQTELNSIVDSFHDDGFSVAFHAMGDRATETVLNSIDYALNGMDNDVARHQLEHNSFIREDLIAQALSLNTIHSVRGYFPTYWQQDYEASYSPEWLERTVNRYSLPGEGLHSYLETDFGFLGGYDEDNWSRSSNIKPFLHLWGLVTRKAIDVNGTIHSPDPWLAEHQITVEQALRMMTIEGAYAVKQENYIGSLEIGKYADLIVIDDDPLTMNPDDLKDINVLLTMVDGNIEFLWSSHTFPTTYNTEISRTTYSLWIILFALSSIIIAVYRRRL